MKLATLLDKVRDDLRDDGKGLDIAKGGDVHPMTVDMVAVATVKALGLAINQQTGQIYNPASERELFPAQKNVRHAGMRRKGPRR